MMQAFKKACMASALAMAAMTAPSISMAQQQALPLDSCGGAGGRACPAGPIGTAAGTVVDLAANPEAGMAAGGYALPSAQPYGSTFPTQLPGAGQADNSFSWRERASDGSTRDCQRGLDGTPRCQFAQDPTATGSGGSPMHRGY